MKEFINIGIGEYAVSNTPNLELRTYALGSCVALVIQDLAKKVSGMAHIALPDSSIEPEKAKRLPCYYADTGVPKLVNAVIDGGGNPERKRLIVKLVGGIGKLNNNIGKRNVLKIRQSLWKLGMGCHVEDVGGDIIRTVYINNQGNQIVRIKSPDGNIWEI